VNNFDAPLTSPLPGPTQEFARPFDLVHRPNQRTVWMARRDVVHQRIEQYVESHLSSAIRTRELASIACVSTSHFNRVFRQRFGCSPAVYVRRHRIRRAQRMMLESAEALAGIALACGFCDEAHFSRTFHRLVGMPPSKWRLRSKRD
jgi:transcriptional regulator GlxA family with amidase domain